jgi:hypothetical protein
MNLLRIGVLGLLLLLAGGCGGGGNKSNGTSTSAAPGVFADRVIQYAPVNSLGATAAEWPYFFNPTVTLGAPGGMLDVASLGYAVTAGFDLALGYDPTSAAALGGQIVLGLGDAEGHRCLVDGPGDDLAVYENAFRTTDIKGAKGTNTELALVEVSGDSVTWHAFPATVDASRPLIDPARYAGFAGVTPTAEGGDRFDLAAVIAAHGLPADFQACYVRLTDAGTRYADYGNTQSDLWASGADIDAVEGLHSVAAPDQVP